MLCFVVHDYLVVNLTEVRDLEVYSSSRCVHAQSCPTLCEGMVAHQAPLFMGYPRQKYWSGLPFPSPSSRCKRNLKNWCLCL